MDNTAHAMADKTQGKATSTERKALSDQKPDHSQDEASGSAGSRLIGKKIGLVLAGGGAKGAYQIGCWKALKELGIVFDAIAGTSVGALNAALIAEGDLQKALTLWANISRQMIYRFKSNRVFAVVIRLLFIAGLPYARKASSKRLKARLVLQLNLMISWIYCLNLVYALSRGHIIFLNDLGAETPNFLRFRGLYSIPIFFVLSCLAFLCVGIIINIHVLGWYLCERINVAVFDNEPLAGTISRYVDLTLLSKNRIAVFATIARFVDCFDPANPSFLTVPPPTLEAGPELAYNIVYPEKRYIPRYCKLNGESAATIKDLLLRSSSLPYGIFPLRSLTEIGRMDGGLADNMPVLPLIDVGCDIIVVIHLSHTGKYGKEDISTAEGMNQRISLLRRDIALADESQKSFDSYIKKYGETINGITVPRDTANRPPEAIAQSLPNILHIVPSMSIGGFITGTLNFSARKARKLITLGYEDTLNVFEAYFKESSNDHSSWENG
jgi:predicted acylesterase/phospholipase RssA